MTDLAVRTMIRSSLVEVTPALAQKWLDTANEGNRPMSKHVVGIYAQEMKRGHWMLTHQGPAFDYTGRLIDGQHRLAAVALAGLTVPMMVTFDADPDTFAVLDINFKRTAAHVVPGPYSREKAAAARLMTDLPYLRPPRHGDFQNHDAIRIVNEHPQIGRAAEIAKSAYEATRINMAAHTALLTVALESPSATRVGAWVEGLQTGVGLAAGDARLALRNRWAVESKSLNGGRKSEGIYFIVRAWNAYVSDEPLMRLQVPRGGVDAKSMIPVKA